MAVKDIVPVPGGRLEDVLASASPDLLREMIKGFAQRMLDAEAGALLPPRWLCLQRHDTASDVHVHGSGVWGNRY